MPTQTVAIPIFYQQRRQYEILANNTSVTVRLKYFQITGIQGTNVGDIFALRLNNNDMVHESFYILRDASLNNNPNPNVNKISGTRDVPLPIDNSPVTAREWNNPIILTNNRPVANSSYILDPIIVNSTDGFTEPIYEKATIILEIDYVADKYGTTNLSIITPAWRN